MLIVDIVLWAEIEPLKLKIICRLGWDDQLKKIVVLKGGNVAKEILKNRFLDKRYYPKRTKYIEAKMGKAFIRDLCYGLTGSRVWATIPYEKNTI